MNGLRIGLLETALRACIEEYADSGRTFANLDTKAQNTTAIAGILFAAALAFLHGDVLQQVMQQGTTYALILLGAAIIALLSAILLCLLGMKVRKVIAPVDSKTVRGMVEDILRVDSSEFTDTMAENFLRDLIAEWRATLRGMASANESKARVVLVGQALLFIAIALVAVLLLVILITMGWSTPTQT